MIDLNKVVEPDTTCEWENLDEFHQFLDSIKSQYVFSLESKCGAIGNVYKNGADDYLVWFIGFTKGPEGSKINAGHITHVSSHYTPHQALNALCLQMKIDTELLEDEAHEERHNIVIPGDEE